MRVIVDEVACTGCGTCADVCPEVFTVDDDVARVIEDPVAAERQDAAREAAEACPVEAIGVED